ncbi:hypothetical protein [Cylindrospermopsis raciborskii]|uniref:hypothetical protein n=1 Tax=Cylindrospermopsis raciborskii TaxID=77022 RepID=UPI001114D593|nr:hypothetical protein [Cylindrospermopsis raciborskii]
MLLNTPTEKTLFSPRIFWRMVKSAIAHSECFAIARSKWFPNKLPCIFSREKLRVVKKAIAILENENVWRCDRP